MGIRKTLFALSATIIILTAAFSSMLLIQNVTAADPTAWYTTVNGVLKSDYYSLYPFEAKSIDFGLSQFGEMINYPVTAGIGVGLQYPGYDKVSTYDQKKGTSRDPFANEYIDPKLWLNGWLIEIKYTHRTLRDRKVLAMAMFADMTAYGGNWIVGHSPDFSLAPHGGRKTTGYAETEPLQVLYDGPRRYVALSVTHLYDWYDSDGDKVVDHPDETWPLVDVMLTFVFDKVKKQVIIYKDIKQVISGKELDSPLDIQFSNREEWDLGPYPDFSSYAHFFHQEFETCYGAEWHTAPGIMREWIQEGYALTSVPTEKDGYVGPIAAGSVRVYVNGVFKEEGTDYDIDYASGAITWHIPIKSTDWVTVIYKLWKDADDDGEPDAGVPHLYDVAQIISSDLKYVGWKAFWPTLSDYSVDAWGKTFVPLIWVNDADMVPATSEPDIPFVVGEWDFQLGHGYPAQFRGVEVVGLTDYHDALDPQMTGSPKAKLDTEVEYQLNEVFNPWDLVDAVHKYTKRWVQFYNVTEEDVFRAGYGYPLIIRLDQSPVLYEPIWEDYKGFSEKVLWGGALKKPIRSVYTAYDYELYTKSNGTGYIWIPASKVPAAGTVIKILYSTDTFYRSFDYYTFYFEKNGTTSVGDYCFSDIHSWNDWLGATHKFDIEAEYLVTLVGTPAPGASFKISGTLDFYAEDIKVFKEDTAEIGCYKLWNHGTNKWHHEEADNTFDIDFYYFNLSWFITPPPGEDLHIEWAHIDVDYTITIDYNGTHYNTTATFNINGIGLPDPYGVWDPLYVERIPGRYEWTIVGRDSKPVDSIGASLVTAAFKNKQVEIGNAGLDMQYLEYDIQSVPNVMAKFGTKNAWADYYGGSKVTLLTTSTPGTRSALVDDWCTQWPVASSNMITVGGPKVNVLTDYLNDFAEAYYGTWDFSTNTGYGYYGKGAINALSCWSKNYYYSTNETGYAVISTYKDLNGTVIFSIWGVWGRDTFYAAKWFHEEGIYEMQGFPPCVTSIILKIDYTDPKHPTVEPVEMLGTISELILHPDP